MNNNNIDTLVMFLKKKYPTLWRNFGLTKNVRKEIWPEILNTHFWKFGPTWIYGTQFPANVLQV